MLKVVEARDKVTGRVAVSAAALSSRYADFILATNYDQLSPDVVLQVKKLILDLIGVSLAGYKLLEFPRLVVDFMVGAGGTPEASIFQTKGKYPAVNAVFANAACAHALDMDDGHRYAALHPGTVVIPAAFAAAELCGATTREMIVGIVCGYEVMIRIGMGINPSSLGRGFHSTGTVGPFGAVAAAAKIMKLDREATVGAFGLAGLQGSGLLQVNHDEGEGGNAKPINSARAAMSGLFSAMMAKKGARGPERILEGKDGFLGAFTDVVKDDLLTRNLGNEFEICNSYLKFYASGRHAHACIDAAIEAFRASQIEINDIEHIFVETYATAIRFTGIQDVASPSAARFSIAFSIALALIKNGAGAEQFCDENIADKNIQILSRKVEVSIGEKWESLYPNQRGATVKIAARNGETWSSEVSLAKGEPENPASWDEIQQKYYANALLKIPQARATELANTIMDLENVSVADLMGLL